MLQSPDPDSAPRDCGQAPFETVDGGVAGGLVILCDHARADIPARYGNLGLAEADLARHIAYDIGARAVAIGVAEKLGAPAVLSTFSRLLIDPNRGEDDPTLVMRIADGSIVAGNARIGADEIERRLAAFHRPYHGAIDAQIDRAIGAGVAPAIVAIHSFTPRFRRTPRPWHATVLWDSDPRLPVPLIEALEGEGDLVIGENVPYTGRLRGDTLFRHGTGRGLAHALIEIRQDLIADVPGQKEWSARLARILGKLIRSLPELNQVRQHAPETAP